MRALRALNHRICEVSLASLTRLPHYLAILRLWALHRLDATGVDIAEMRSEETGQTLNPLNEGGGVPVASSPALPGFLGSLGTRLVFQVVTQHEQESRSQTCNGHCMHAWASWSRSQTSFLRASRLTQQFRRTRAS